MAQTILMEQYPTNNPEKFIYKHAFPLNWYKWQELVVFIASKSCSGLSSFNSCKMLLESVKKDIIYIADIMLLEEYRGAK